MNDYDVIVIGSGFGGAVTALRLTEKGYRVAVLEAGRRFEDDDFADSSWDLKSYLFRPEIGCYGIQRIDALKDCLILSGAGVGGGSLVYANTLYEPLDPFYNDPSWRDITDWKAELAPYYEQAKRMLGVVQYPYFTPADEVMKQAAEEMGSATPSTRRRSVSSSACPASPRTTWCRTPTSAAPDPTATRAATAGSA